MSSSYSDRLKLELMTTGANANTWGTNTNNNLDVIDAFAAGYLSKSVAGSSNITLTTANASDTAESSNKTIELTGALTGDIVVFIPAVESEYNFFNNTSGSQTLTIAATGHTANGVVIAQSAKTTVFCDGASNYNVEIISSTDAGALGSGTLPDARFPATLPAISGANLTNLDAADLASGTIPDARFPATLPALNGSALTNLDADNLASGTVGSARLPTVPTTKGGTGLTSIGTAGQAIVVNSGASALEFAAVGGGGYNLQVFNSPGTYSPPADLHTVKVSVQAGGGGGGGAFADRGAGGRAGGGGFSIEHIPVASIPGPVSVTVGSGGSGGGGNGGNGNSGGSSSFGSFTSANGGGGGNGGTFHGGPGSDGSDGSGSGGDINWSALNGATQNGFGGSQAANGSSANGQAGSAYGGGGGGGGSGPGAGGSGGAGAAGFVLVEEYFG
jgi:hypothetical protein